MKHRALLFVLFITCILFTTTEATEVYKPCDAGQGFYLQPEKNSRIGFITRLKIGSIPDLKPDFITYDPQDPSKEIPVFAVLRYAAWGVRPDNPIYFSGQISAENKSAIAFASPDTMSKTDVQFQFAIYDFNRQNGLYYKSFHSKGGEMRGQIEKNEDGLSLSVEDKPWPRIETSETYTFSISILPTLLEQIVHFSLKPDKEITRPWRAKNHY